MEVAARMACAGVMRRSVPCRMPAAKMSPSAEVATASTASMLRGSQRDPGEQETHKKGETA
jgi:hypothetical protein